MCRENNMKLRSEMITEQRARAETRKERDELMKKLCRVFKAVSARDENLSQVAMEVMIGVECEGCKDKEATAASTG